MRWPVSIVAVVAVLPPGSGVAQSPTDDGESEDEVSAYVRELRSARAETPRFDSVIRVEATHYIIGERRFGTLSELRDYVIAYRPGTFLVRIRDCSNKPMADEVVALLGDLARDYIERLPDAGGGKNFLYDQGFGAPRECIR